jgi:hypothetical protein
MKKKGVIRNVTMGLLLITSMLVMINHVEEASAQTWTVNNQGGADFPTIYDAVQAAGSGDCIAVSYGTGTYSEQPITINIPLTITGEIYNNSIPTISAQNSNENVITITGSTTRPVHIENFVITGATGATKAGIYSSAVGTSTYGISFQNIRVTGNYYGIYLTSASSYHLIDDCYIYTNTDDGIILNGLNHDVDDCGSSYTANTGIYSNGGDGIASSYLMYSTIEDTNIYDNGGNGIYFTNANQNSILRTEIWNNDLKGVYLSGASNTLDGSLRNIKNNYYGCITADLYDIFIIGTLNTIQDYNVYQTSETLDTRTGIFISSSSQANPHDIINCNVYGYDCDDGDSIGIQAYNTDILGSTMRVHDCDYGIKMDDNCELDCDNTAFTYENIYDNYIGVSVIGSDTVIKETYFTADGNGGTGIYINNNNDCDADIDDCEFELMGSYGIHIVDSTSSCYSTIDDCAFDRCLVGIYIDDGNSEDITSCDFDGSGDIGIKLNSAINIDIYLCSFDDFIVDDGDDYSTKDVGIFGYSTTYTDIEDCTFNDNEKGIWFDYNSEFNNIIDCDFNNDDEDEYGDWGDYDCEIGIYLTAGSDYTDIEECDFDEIKFAIGVSGSQDVDIDGDSSGYSIISNADYAIYATYSGTTESSGDISYYGQANTVCLIGVPSGSSTDFTYSNLNGNWNVDNLESSNYSWS